MIEPTVGRKPQDWPKAVNLVAFGSAHLEPGTFKSANIMQLVSS